jgi:hypothetical protein
MANGKARAYYWHIFTRLVELANILVVTHPRHNFPSEDEVVSTNALHAMLVFTDGSRLIANTILDTETAVREHTYAYVYMDADRQRIFQYDDAPHHSELNTYPDHFHKGAKPNQGVDRAYALDIPDVNFVAILEKIVSLISS